MVMVIILLSENTNFSFETMHKTTTCQFKIKFNTEDYLLLYKTLQLFANIFTFNTNKFTSIEYIKNTLCTGTMLLKFQAH
jgi:hypothetical protein